MLEKAGRNCVWRTTATGLFAEREACVKYLIGIDVGTSGTKAALFDSGGACVADATHAYPLYQPQNGWAEQDPRQWWQACASAIRDILAKASIPASSIAGVGLSGQMHGLVMLDKQGDVLRNCILWCDGRTTAECAQITDTVGRQRLLAVTANPALPGFTAGKLLWVRSHEPELYRRCRHVLLPKDYIRYCLCGVFATEVSDASGTNLLDVPNRRWSGEILSALHIEPSLLPDVFESCEVTGHLTKEAAKATGLPAGLPVVGGGADNAAAAIGMGVVESGKALTTIGTSGVILAHSDTVQIDPKGRIHTFCSAVPGAWIVMSCTLAAGGSLQWFRNNFCMDEMREAEQTGVDPYAILDGLAEHVPIGANRLLFLPYLMGERSPILDENARGCFFGLSGMHTRHDLLRAVLEGVVYSLRDCLEVLRELDVRFDEMAVTGGGGNSRLWRQMLADVYRCPVVRKDNREGAALGAAILAGVGVGLYPDLRQACQRMIRVRDSLEPVCENSGRYEPYYRLYHTLYPALQDSFGTLAGLSYEG